MARVSQILGIGMLMLLACAANDAVLQKRESVRRFNNAETSAVTVESYRSAEGVRGVTWGLTIDELVALKHPPEHRNQQVYLYTDQVDGVSVPTTYAFFAGHLAQVKSRYDSAQVDPKALEARLVEHYGLPTPFAEFDDARSWDLAMSVIGNSASSGSYPLYWGFGVASQEAVNQALASTAKPARDVMWVTQDTRVHLLVLDTGLTEVSWTSRFLGYRFVNEQRTGAGLAQVSDEL